MMKMISQRVRAAFYMPQALCKHQPTSNSTDTMDFIVLSNVTFNLLTNMTPVSNKTLSLNTTLVSNMSLLPNDTNVTLPSYRAPGMHPITTMLTLLLVITCVLVYGGTNLVNFYAKMKLARRNRQDEFLSRAR